MDVDVELRSSICMHMCTTRTFVVWRRRTVSVAVVAAAVLQQQGVGLRIGDFSPN
jgi:hypothetical protein